MKKMTLIALAALAMGFQACKSSNSGSNADSTATTSASDSGQAVSASADTASTPSAGSDTVFAQKAAVGGMAEVALGKMASGKGVDAKIKDFGNMMVMDHSKANTELMGIAKANNIKLPVVVDLEHKTKSDSLSKLSGKDFDKAYAAAMVADHQKTLALMQDEAQNGSDEKLKAFAAKTAPVVKQHLDEITKIQATIK